MSFIDQYVTCHLPMSTDFNDYAPSHEFQHVGVLHGTTNPVIVTTPTNFVGYGAGAFTNSKSQYLTYAASNDWAFTNLDFTVEYWARSITGQNSAILRLSTGPESGYPGSGAAMYKGGIFGNIESRLNLYLSSTGTGWDIANAATMGAFPGSSWVHYAVTRTTVGGTSYIGTFRNGYQMWFKDVGSVSIVVSDVPIELFKEDYHNLYGSGYLQQLRILKGYSLYHAVPDGTGTKIFTPSVTPYTPGAPDIDMSSNIFMGFNS